MSREDDKITELIVTLLNNMLETRELLLLLLLTLYLSWVKKHLCYIKIHSKITKMTNNENITVKNNVVEFPLLLTRLINPNYQYK